MDIPRKMYCSASSRYKKKDTRVRHDCPILVSFFYIVFLKEKEVGAIMAPARIRLVGWLFDAKTKAYSFLSIHTEWI